MDSSLMICSPAQNALAHPADLSSHKAATLSKPDPSSALDGHGPLRVSKRTSKAEESTSSELGDVNLTGKTLVETRSPEEPFRAVPSASIKHLVEQSFQPLKHNERRQKHQQPGRSLSIKDSEKNRDKLSIIATNPKSDLLAVGAIFERFKRHDLHEIKQGILKAITNKAKESDSVSVNDAATTADSLGCYSKNLSGISSINSGKLSVEAPSTDNSDICEHLEDTDLAVSPQTFHTLPVLSLVDADGKPGAPLVELYLAMKAAHAAVTDLIVYYESPDTVVADSTTKRLKSAVQKGLHKLEKTSQKFKSGLHAADRMFYGNRLVRLVTFVNQALADLRILARKWVPENWKASLKSLLEAASFLVTFDSSQLKRWGVASQERRQAAKKAPANNNRPLIRDTPYNQAPDDTSDTEQDGDISSVDELASESREQQVSPKSDFAYDLASSSKNFRLYSFSATVSAGSKASELSSRANLENFFSNSKGFRQHVTGSSNSGPSNKGVQSSSAQPTELGKSYGKRQRLDQGEDGNRRSREGGGDPKRVQHDNGPDPTPNSKKYACPYEAYGRFAVGQNGTVERCSKKGFTDTHRVKEHLQRCHDATNLPKGYNGWPGSRELMTDEQKINLKQLPRRRSQKQKWFDIAKCLGLHMGPEGEDANVDCYHNPFANPKNPALPQLDAIRGNKLSIKSQMQIAQTEQPAFSDSAYGTHSIPVAWPHAPTDLALDPLNFDGSAVDPFLQSDPSIFNEPPEKNSTVPQWDQLFGFSPLGDPLAQLKEQERVETPSPFPEPDDCSTSTISAAAMPTEASPSSLAIDESMEDDYEYLLQSRNNLINILGAAELIVHQLYKAAKYLPEEHSKTFTPKITNLAKLLKEGR